MRYLSLYELRKIMNNNTNLKILKKQLKNSDVSDVIQGLLNSFDGIFWSFSIEDSIFYDFFKKYIRKFK